jgi:hypothetical protein
MAAPLGEPDAANLEIMTMARRYLYFLAALCGFSLRSFAGPPIPQEDANVPITTDPNVVTLIVKGRVVDSLGTPLADVETSAVVLSRQSKDHPLAGGTVARVVGQTRTDASGSFTMRIRRASAPADVALELFAYAKGHVVAGRYLDMEAERHNVTIELSQGTKVVGTVLSGDGEPMDGATVALSSLTIPDGSSTSFPFAVSPPGLTAWPHPAVTDQQGTFALEGVPADASIELELNDKRAARERWIFPAAARSQNLALHATSAREVVGRIVFGDSGLPVRDATVGLMSSDRLGAYLGSVSVTTDARGRFRVRPYSGSLLSVRVTCAHPEYPRLSRSIPWPKGTTTQQMTLPLYTEDHEVLDETTSDGRAATSIDHDYPAGTVVEAHPSRRLEKRLSGTIIAGASLTTIENNAAKPVKGLIAIDPESGRWRLIVEGAREGRVSPDGELLAYNQLSADGLHLHLVSTKALSEPRWVSDSVEGPACWLTVSGAQSLVINVPTPAKREYLGQKYWGEEGETWRLGVDGIKTAAIPLPALNDVWDATADGQWLAMHWDTHAVTGSQLFVARADGTDLRPVARKKRQYYWYPRFSHDGKSVVAKHLDPATGVHSLRLLSLQGDNEVAILSDGGSGPDSACWSPDDLCLAVVTNCQLNGGRTRGSKLMIVNAEGTQIREVFLANATDLHLASIDWTGATHIAL